MKKDNRVKKSSLFSYLEKQYIESYVFLGIIILMCVRVFNIYVSYMLRSSSFPFNALSSIGFALLQIAFVVGLIVIIVRRIRAHTFLDTFLIYRLFKISPLIYKTIAKIVFPLALVIFFWMLAQINSFYGIMNISIMLSLLLFIINCLGIIDQMGRIKNMINDMAEGKRDEITVRAGMYEDTKDITQQLTNIDQWLQDALEESMKAEHLKTELITNVSHDIKTPLTSIINYIDLLKKQDIKDETAVAYLGILERNASRLKILTNDLVEASKTSTGNIELNLEELGLVELIAQAYGGFDTQFAKKNIEFVFDPTDEITVFVDGNYTWRVFQNLFSNAVKYSLENTRVYGEVFVKEQYAHFVLKNVSAEQLNISEQELMEQFVQGERSRHTEGSGLGLYIAKNIMELMDGELEININGDLFEADVSLKMPQ